MKILKMIIFFFIFTVGNGFAGEYPGWEGFPPMYSIKDMIEFNGYIFGITNGGLFRYEPSTQEYKLFYKDHGLINNDVFCIGATSQELFIGYPEDGLWLFDPEGENSRQILFPEYHIKTISAPNGIAVRNIYALNDSILYVGHALGLDMLNLNTEELRTYTNLGPDINEGTPVNEVKIFGGRIWVCTPHGLAVADEDNPNLEFEENWKSYTYEKTGITCILHAVDEYDDIIYIGTDTVGFVYFDEKNDKIVPLVSTGMGNPVINKMLE